MKENAPHTIEQKIFSSQYVERLFIEISESKDISKYSLESFPCDPEYPKGGTEIFVRDNINLVNSEGIDKKDLENTKIIYDAYKSLTPTQASDPRLWTYLTHVSFWDYMQQRWPVNEVKNPLNRIRNRYFLRRLNLESLTRNGLSRLWWYGHLTYDQSRSNPWELTEILLSRADLVVGITERGLGSNEAIRTAMLEFLQENPDICKSETITREMLVKINLLGGVVNLPFLEKDELKEIINNMKKNLLKANIA